MKSMAKRMASVFALIAVIATLGLLTLACGGKDDEPPKHDPTPPVKVADGIDFELAAGKSKNLTVADYITVNDYAASASVDNGNATASVDSGLLTVTGVAEGDAVVTLSCDDISVTFGVTVYTEYKVTVDGNVNFVRKGETFTLPKAPAIADENMEFDCWLVGEEQEHKAVGDVITVNGDVTVTSATKRKAAVKVKDGEPVSVNDGGEKKLDVSQYITAYGAEVTAESDTPAVVTASVADGKIVFTAVAEGTAKVAVKCGKIEIEFDVTVTAAPVTYKVTVDGELAATANAGETFTLPAAIQSPDDDFEFAGWNVDGEVKQPGETVTVNSDLNITVKLERKAAEKKADGITLNLSVDGSTYADINVSDYIVTHGRDVSASSQDGGIATAETTNVKLTVTAVAVGYTTVSLTCGEVTVTFPVVVTSAADNAPVFKNGAIDFDLFDATSGSYEFEITVPEGANFTYEYAVTPDTGVTINGNTLTYTATDTVSNLVLSVNVTATDAVLGVKSASFSVTVNVTDTTPTVKTDAVTVSDTVDLFDGALTINLADNIENADKVSSYKVNGNPVVGTVYTVTGEYTENATPVIISVEAVINASKSVSYTYTVNVKNTRPYRMANGNFDNGTEGWTLSNSKLGGVNNATVYWTEHRKSFNAVGNFFNAYTNVIEDGELKIAQDGDEGAKGTLVSPTFKVGGSGYITYRFGGAKEKTLVYIEVVESGTDVVLDRFANELFNAEDNNGCALIAYKANLGSHLGKTAYIRITDNSSANYGLFFVDEFKTYYPQEPGAEFNLAHSQAHLKYQVANGGFENGNLDGWTLIRKDGCDGDFAAVTKDLKYFDGTDYGKDGDYLFSGAAGKGNGNPDGTNPDGMENNMGVLKSDNFILKSNTWISFKLGGGNHDYLGIRIVKADGTVLASFNNTHIAAREGELVQYVYQFTGMTEDVECYVEIFDTENTDGDGWRLITADSIVTYYADEPVLDGAVKVQ